eukprot:TRINITY_DN6511_c0_g1_i1.p1 TRINITY_DN6511_c0_g1~~TRINITY_DN6511_c0_g1_i1.p1  ORF type:complete len:328 (+),score=96.25 TRINITY_DN6511_c0_g1_i1:89-985(+)
MKAAAAAKRPLRVAMLGRVPYAPCLELQQRLWERRRAGEGVDTLLAVEHCPPVYTVGRRDAGLSDLLLSEEELRARGITVHRIGRGGRATWHGPGQLTAYPICHVEELRRGAGGAAGAAGVVRWWVSALEEAVMRTLHHYGLRSWSCGDVGVWLGGPVDPAAPPGSAFERLAEVDQAHRFDESFGAQRKVAAVGVQLSRYVSMHGVALNVTGEALEWTAGIVPCGLEGTAVTAVGEEAAAGGAAPAVSEVAEVFLRSFLAALHQPVDLQPVSAAELCAELGLAPSELGADPWPSAAAP